MRHVGMVVLIAAALLPSTSTALVRAYSIEPVQQSWSGMADPNPLTGGVSEYVTCCWDELDSSVGAYVELFAGGACAPGARA